MVIRPNTLLRRTLVTLVFLAGAGLPWLAVSAEFSPIPGTARMTDAPKAAVPFDLTALKRNWRQRITAMKSAGVMPIIDIESNLGENLDIQSFARSMDNAGVALIAFSGLSQGRGWSDAARYAVAADPWRYIPAGDGGLPPDWKNNPVRFAEITKERITQDGYPMMGEYEFRHYPSPDQIERGNLNRDEDLPIYSPAGHRLFQFASDSGIPFQIHQEIEDSYVLALEKMLAQYPKAKVIWCHLAQMRYQARNTIYGPEYVRDLIKKYPNLYFDLLSGPPDHVYPQSGEYPGRYWDRSTGLLKPEWAQLIADHPWRFMTALDLNPYIMAGFSRKVAMQRAVLQSLPEASREIVAYKAAWKLLFNEDFEMN
jgi:predicted TIM-barrel fold metal-dependent hydrolase